MTIYKWQILWVLEGPNISELDTGKYDKGSGKIHHRNKMTEGQYIVEVW